MTQQDPMREALWRALIMFHRAILLLIRAMEKEYGLGPYRGKPND